MSTQRCEEKSAPARGCPEWGKRKRERESGREREPSPLAPLFTCFPLPAPVLCKLDQPGVLFVLPEVLTPVLGPSFALFWRAFPFLVFSHPILDSFSLFYLPNNSPCLYCILVLYDTPNKYFYYEVQFLAS